MAQVPVQLGTGLRQHPVLGPDIVSPAVAAVLKMPARDILDLGSDGLVPGQVHREMADAVQHPRNIHSASGQRLDLACGEPTQLRRSVVGKKDVQIPKRQKLAAGVCCLNVDPFLVPAFHLTPVQRVIGKYVGSLIGVTSSIH